jgi:hypothetical protein
MRRSGLALLAILGLGLLGLLALGRPGWLARIGLGGDRATLQRLASAFIEDLQFKDFEKAASYHAPEVQAAVDIPFLIERLFLIKPEQLDIMEHEVLRVDIDSSDLRARVKVRVKLKDLTRGNLHDRELMLYFQRAAPDAPWNMQLESSLRQGEAEKNKKH